MITTTTRSWSFRIVVSVCAVINIYVCVDTIRTKIDAVDDISGSRSVARGQIHGLTDLPDTNFLVSVVDKTEIELNLDIERQESQDIVAQRRAARRVRLMVPANAKATDANVKGSQLQIMSISESPREVHASASSVRSAFQKAKQGDLCGALAKLSAMDNPQSFSANDALNKDSKVFIHGILTPLGFHLALAIEERCGAQVATGFDNTFPNTIRDQMERQERLGILVSQLHLQRNVMNSFVGLDQIGAKPPIWPRLNLTGELDIVAWQPTHIVNVASYASEAYRHTEPRAWRNDWDPYSQEGKYDTRMFGIHSNTVAMEQILQGLALKKDKARVPHYLYASSNMIPQLKSSSLSQIDRGQARNSQLVEVLADAYHQVHGIYSVAMRFPNAVIGSRGYPDSDVYRILKSEVSKSSFIFSKPWASKKLDMVHMNDIVDVIIAAMQFRSEDNRPVAFTPTANVLVSPVSVQNAVADITKGLESVEVEKKANPMLYKDPSVNETARLLGWKPKLSVRKGLLRTAAWYLDQLNPYKDPRNVHDATGPYPSRDELLKRHNLGSCPQRDTACRSSRRALPCASECNVEDACISTPFDSIVSETKAATVGCKTVVYTVLSVEKMPLVRESNSSSVCYLSVIGENSRAAKSLSSAPSNTLQHRGWKIVLVNLESMSASTAESFLMKLSPGTFFSKSVTHAMYVDAKRRYAPTIETVSFLVSQLTQPSWVPSGDPNPKHEQLPLPGLASMLVPQLLYKEEGGGVIPEDTLVDLNAAVKIMKLASAPSNRQEDNIEKFRLFLERIPTFTDRREFLRSVTEPFFPYGIHHWIGTGWVVHNIGDRDLRCDWYQETIQWDMPLDQLSFAHIMAKRAMDHCHRYVYPQMEYFESKGIPFGVSDSSERLAYPETHRPCPIVFAYAAQGAESAPELPLELQTPEYVTARIYSNSTMYKARHAWLRAKRRIS